MDLLKEESVNSDRIWKAAGKPRCGPLFDRRQSCRLIYHKRLREAEKSTLTSYSNDLHDCLMGKDDGPQFWKCWRSKFELTNKCNQIDGCVDNTTIVTNFAKHFAAAYSCNNVDRNDALKADYLQRRPNYCGFAVADEQLFDIDFVTNVICNLKRGKAAGLDDLTAEHLLFCNPIIASILSTLFNLILQSGHVPASFGLSYTIPIPKIKDCRTKAMSVDDFRGIAISCILSKVFEMCIFGRFSDYFSVSDNQFGFKKGLGCSHAIYTLRQTVEFYVNGGSTVTLCALDLSKAFDKTNHYALFLKLMKRNLPVELLNLFENWFRNCFT